MSVGGSTTDLVPATTVVEIQDFNQGTYLRVLFCVHGPSLNHGRKFIVPVILPNGRNKLFLVDLLKVGAIQCSFRKSLIPKMRVKAGLI